MNTKIQTIDEYIAPFPKAVQVILEEMRRTIHAAAPDATEAMAYGIPTFKLNVKNLVHFGGFKAHIGFFPAPSGIEPFKEELSKYQTGKGTIQFPLDQPIPYELVTRVVQYRVKETQETYPK